MISVCMASYNGEKFIKEQINSILEQLSENDELIISDDGSTDTTCMIVEEYQDQRIKLIHNHNHHGYTANFYNALKVAKGDYIFLSDQDDVWDKDKVNIVLEYLQNYDFVHTNAIITDSHLNPTCYSRNDFYNVKSGFLNNLLRSRYLGCCMAFRKEVLQSIFPVPTYTNRYPHDLWIALIASKYFKSVLIKEPLIFYRRHENNSSDGGKGMTGGLFLLLKKICIRFYYFYYVFKQKEYIV